MLSPPFHSYALKFLFGRFLLLICGIAAIVTWQLLEIQHSVDSLCATADDIKNSQRRSPEGLVLFFLGEDPCFDVFCIKQAYIVDAALVICDLVSKIQPQFKQLTSSIFDKLDGELSQRDLRYLNLAQAMHSLAIMRDDYCTSKRRMLEKLKRNKCA